MKEMFDGSAFMNKHGLKILVFYILFSALLLGVAFATQNTVSGNFSGASIAATDTVILGGNAVVDGGPYTFKALWMPAGANYTLTESGTSIVTLTGDGMFWKDSTTGAKTYPDSIAVLNTSGQMRISSQVGSFSFSSGTSWHFAGDDTIYDFKGLSGKHLHNKTKTVLQNTTSSTGFLYVSGTMLVLEENSKFIVNSNGIAFNFNSDGDFISMANGASISGSGSIRVNAGSGANITVDTFCYSGTSSGGFSLTSAGNVAAGSSTSLTQGVCCEKSLNIYKNSGGFGFTFNTNGYPINGTTLMNGNGSTTSGSQCTFNYGASVLNFPFGFLSTSQNANPSQINWQTCTASWGGNFAYGSQTSADPGTSLHIFNGSAAQVVTSAGESFAYLTIQNTGTATVIFADSTYCLYDFSALDGRDSIGRLYVGGNYTNTSNDSVFHYDTTIIAGSFLRDNDKTKRDGGAMSFRGVNNGTITLQDAGSCGRLTIRKSVPSATMTAAANLRAHRILDSVGALKMLSYSLACTTLTSYSSGLQCAAVTLDTLNAHASGILGGGTITRWNWRANGIAWTMATGTTLTVSSVDGIGGTTEAPDTLQGAGAGSTYTGPQDTLSHTRVALLTCTNPLYLDSSANTGGNNTNVRSLSYTGATLSSATGLAGDTIGISTGNGLVGGAASIGDSAVTLTVVNSDSGYIVVPLAMPVGTYDVKIWNSDADTVTLSGGMIVPSSSIRRRANRGWLGLGVWIGP